MKNLVKFVYNHYRCNDEGQVVEEKALEKVLDLPYEKIPKKGATINADKYFNNEDVLGYLVVNSVNQSWNKEGKLEYTVNLILKI